MWFLGINMSWNLTKEAEDYSNECMAQLKEFSLGPLVKALHESLKKHCEPETQKLILNELWGFHRQMNNIDYFVDKYND